MGNRLLLGAFNVCANSVRVIPAFTADTCSRMSNMRVVVRCWSCAIQVVPFPYRKLPDAGVVYGRMLPISIITSSSLFASNVKAQQKNTRNDRNGHSSHEGDTGQERENRFEIVSKMCFRKAVVSAFAFGYSIFDCGIIKADHQRQDEAGNKADGQRDKERDKCHRPEHGQRG